MVRPAGRGELDSLYFDYPRYRFQRPPELDGKTFEHPVAIAGAGPVGLTAAVALASQGIPCVILDNKDTVNDGSRAICISRYSFETLQQLRVEKPFVEKGLGWIHGRCYYRDTMIYRLTMPHSGEERFFPMYNIQQQYIEQYLVDACARHPDLIDMRWLSEVTGVRITGQGVTITVDTPEGEYELKARYLLAADGGKSTVRKKLGLRMNGANLPGHYVIADIKMIHDFPTERRSFFESDANPRATILIHREPDNIWRVDWQLQEGEDADESVREDNIRTRVQAILDMIGHRGPWELEWWSIYTANTLCLDDYRHGPVLFIGDAAHIVPIFGVRGLNNGIADAANAAWKLAYVLKGAASETLLDSYSPERRGATLDVFANAGKSSRFMTPPTRGFKLMRKAVLELSLTQEFTRKFADPRQVQPYTYRESPLTAFRERDDEFSGGPTAGAAAVNSRIADNDYLLDHVGCGFTALYFTGNGEVPAWIAELFAHIKKTDKNFVPIIISREIPQRDEPAMIHNGKGNIFKAYDATDNTFYLLRPDRHIAARWRSVVTEEVKEALSVALGGKQL